MLGQPGEEHAPAREQLRPRHRALGQAEQHAETGRQELAVHGIRHPSLQALVKALCDRGDGCVLGDPEPLANDVRERRVGDPLAVGEAAAAVPQDGLGETVDVLVELPQQARLADPRLAADRHQARGAVFDRAVEEILEQPQIAVATDQRRLQPTLALGTAHARDDTYGPPQVERFGLAFDRVLAGVLVGDRKRGRLARDAVDEHGPRVRRRLGPRRGVDAVTDDKSFPRPIHRGRPAGHDPTPGGQLRKADRLPERAHRLDQLEPRTDRPLGVVLARHRRTPDGHDRVADELLERAAVAAHDRAGSVEVAAQQFPHVLGLARLRERRVADDVHEQHRDQTQLWSVGHRRAARSAAARRTRRRTSAQGRGAPSRTGSGAPARPRTQCRILFAPEPRSHSSDRSSTILRTRGPKSLAAPAPRDCGRAPARHCCSLQRGRGAASADPRKVAESSSMERPGMRPGRTSRV